MRQLENFLEREFLLAGTAGVLRLSVLAGGAAVPQGAEQSCDESWNYGDAKARVVERFDREFLGKLMQHTRGNVAQAARIASKERRDLGRLLQRYGISPQQFRRA